MDKLFIMFQNYLPILLEPSVVLIVGILTIVVTRNSTKHDVSLDRLTYAYHPIFLIIEAHLFKSIEKSNAKEFIEKYSKIESNYLLYICPSLRYRVDLLSNALKSDSNQSSIDEHWMIICKYVDREYDRLCKLSHIPIRSAAYRLNNNQYSTKISLYLGMFKLFFLPLTSLYIILFILALIFS